MIRGVKASKIVERTFKFDGDKIKNKLDYQGKMKVVNGKQHFAPDKRFDENCEGLCIFIYKSGKKVFYAFKSVEMFNHKTKKLMRNNTYRKIFTYQDVQGFKYRDAKDKLKETLDKISAPVKVKEKKLFKDLALEFYKEGMKGARTKGFEENNYKQSSIARYKNYIDSYILLKHSNKQTIKKLTQQIVFRNRLSNRPIGDYMSNEIEVWHLEVLKKRLEQTPSTAENVIGMISTIYTWAKENNVFKGDNPADNFSWTGTNPIKAKLLDSDTAKLREYIHSKAFEYQPHFLTCVGLHLYTGQRSLDIFGLRWSPPVSEEERLDCSGWLVEGWETSNRPKFYIWSMKNHKEVYIHIDQMSLKLLKRLKEANLREKNKWALKSPFVFPKRHSFEWTHEKYKPVGHATYSSYQKPLKKLNKVLGFERLEGDNISRIKRGKRKIFTFKIARKTFATEIARNKGGIELAARKLNHYSSAITKKNYIVPDDDEMIVENIYEKNLPEKDTTVFIKSPWNNKEDIDKK
jgi:hypothetical protein